MNTNGLIRNKHMQCIIIIIQKHMSFLQMSSIQHTRKITNEKCRNDLMIAIVEEIFSSLTYLGGYSCSLGTCPGKGLQLMCRPSGVNEIASNSIRSCTLFFKARQFSIEWPGAPEWNSHLAFASYPRGRRVGGGTKSLISTN